MRQAIGRPEIVIGQIWRDKDKRESRRVKVLSVHPTQKERNRVRYCAVAGPDLKEYPPIVTSRYDRFQRAFELVQG